MRERSRHRGIRKLGSSEEWKHFGMVGLWREVGRAEEGAGHEIGGFSRNQSQKHPFSCILVSVFS